LPPCAASLVHPYLGGSDAAIRPLSLPDLMLMRHPGMMVEGARRT
jgi:hypothetical protein